jgi:hypothetical protein
MANRIADLTPEEQQTLKTLIAETVRELLEMYIDDGESDEGLEFRPEVEERLLAFLRDQPEGEAATDVFRELGLDG